MFQTANSLRYAPLRGQWPGVDSAWEQYKPEARWNGTFDDRLRGARVMILFLSALCWAV